MATAGKKNSEGKSLSDLAHSEPPALGASGLDKALYGLARYSVQNDHYVGLYETWSKAVLFLLGRHWLIWNKSKRRYGTDTDVPSWTQQPVTQVVYAVYRSAIAKLTKQKPALEVVPPSSDSDDRESAHIAESLITHLWRLCKVPATIKRALGWFFCTGQVYLRVYWDEEAGKLVPLTQLVEVPHSDPNRAALGETEDVQCPCGPDGEPLLTEPDETGQQYPDPDAEPHLVPQGDIALGIESPMSVRYNPEAETPDDAYEMYVARLWPLDRAAAHFGIEKDTIESGKDEDRGQYDDLMSSAAAAQPDTLGTFGGASQEEAIGARCLVIEYYHDRTEDCPKGRHWISIGETVVWPKADDPEYPHQEAELPNGFWPPLIAVQDVPVPGQIQALGLIPQVVPLNEALNTLDGKILENDLQMAMGGKWIVHPDDRGLSIDSSPGQVLASKGYAEGKPPVQAEIKPLPAQVYQERAVIMNKVSLVTGLDRETFGETPQGTTPSGRAMLVTQEKSDSVYAPTLESWEHALEEVGRRMIVLAQQHYTEARDIQIRGERGKWEVRSFLGADLSDGMDVRVQVGSSFPWSKAAQWDARVDMLSKFPGLVQSPTGEVDKEALSRYMDTGAPGLGTFESDEDSDLVEVQREHAMFEAFDPMRGQNQLPQLAMWQSQPKHLAAHFDFMKRDRARFDKWTPQAQQAFLQHMQLTAQAVDGLAGQMVGGPAGGAPPDEGAPEEGGPPNLQLMPGGGAPSAQSGGAVSAPTLQPHDFAAAGQ